MRLGVQAALVGGELLPGDVELADGRIAAVGLASPDGRGIAVPGFVDLQVNGFGGVDFLEADAAGYARAGDALLETGVTGYLPTLITSSEEHLRRRAREVPLEAEGPRILGVHLEGPFLSPERPRHASGRLPARPGSGAARAAARGRPGPARHARAGASRRVRPDRAAPRARRRRLLRAHRCHRRGGARRLRPRRPHGDPPLQRDAAVQHRDPGIAGAALTRPDVVVQIIVDGVHLAPDTVRLVLAGRRRPRGARDRRGRAGAGAGAGAFTLGDLSWSSATAPSAAPTACSRAAS